MANVETENRVTIAQMASELGLDAATVRYWIELGKLPGTYLKKRGAKRGMYLVSRKELDRFLEGKWRGEQ